MFLDVTNPRRASGVGDAARNYYDLGIQLFWLDEAEPEYGVYDFDNYRYHPGKRQVGNIYPQRSRGLFYEGQVGRRPGGAV